MKILAIETSCDETAVSIVQKDGDTLRVLGNALFSQVETHKTLGGVVPSLAKREHARNMVPLLSSALKEAGLYHKGQTPIPSSMRQEIFTLLEREQDLGATLLEFLEHIERPALDALAVTEGPGLEPALWVGINAAKTLARVWDLPLIPINHMEGHIVSALLTPISNDQFLISTIQFPALALLISGGHTELVEMDKLLSYIVLGATKDDAVGEAFDKVARMLGLSYPGGPHISRLAKEARAMKLPALSDYKSTHGRGKFYSAQKTEKIFPRPMLHSNDLHFSFAGLKTAVRYFIRDTGELTDIRKRQIAREFEDAVVEVLIAKTEKAIQERGSKTLIVGGGVAANTEIRRALGELSQKFPGLRVVIPEHALTTDNAVMIAVAAQLRVEHNSAPVPIETIIAEGNLSL